MKKNIRVMGIDDARFGFNDEITLVCAVVVRAPDYVEAVLSSEVDVDGTNSTEKLIDLINRSRHKEQLKALIIDGAALGGFNIIDLEELYRNCNVPIITVTRSRPDFESIKLALKDHFNDWEKRWNLISSGDIFEIKTNHTPVYVKVIGLSRETAIELIKLTTVRGALPEPLRLAHLIASGIATGESRGRA